MNFKKHLSVIAPIVTLFAISGSAFADRYANSVRYDLVVQHAHDLEYIATDLKDCFRNQFRGTRNYGKLISRSNKLRNRSRDLYRHGVARGNCNWQVEIQRLDDIVCELNDLVDETIFRSRRGYGAPLCGNAVRTVRRLMGKAEYHVRELQRSLFQVGTRSFKQPVFQPNILESPAPSYLPPTGIHRTQTGIGSGVYRSGPSYKPH
ncbi:MAG: hypothetical protein AAGA30_14620, partial [Planctomycetota bacterium]